MVISSHNSFLVLFDKIASVYFICKINIWKWPEQGTGTVPVVSAHFCSLSTAAKFHRALCSYDGASMRCASKYTRSVFTSAAQRRAAYVWTAHCGADDFTQSTHTHTSLTAIFPGPPGWAGTRKVNKSGFYWSKEQWVAVASAGPYASLHLAPDR